MQNPIGDEQGVQVILQGHSNAMSDKVIGKGFDNGTVATPLKGFDKRLLMGIIGEGKDGDSVHGGELHPPSDRSAEEPQGWHVGLACIDGVHGDIRRRLMGMSEVSDRHRCEPSDDGHS
jgi:hypothetical protein